MNRDSELEADLDVVRELLHKYGLQQVEHMVQIAGRSLYEPSISSSSRASIVSSAATSISRGTSSGFSYYTDTSSLRSHPSSMYMPSLPVRSSNGTSIGSGTSTPGESSLPPDLPPLPDAATLSELDGDGSGDGSRAKLQCPFCTEYDIGQWIGRKPDLKRHFNKIHASNALWTCKLGGGCNLTFDFHTAYDSHVKKEHGGVRDPDAKANLCQQVVWACGFETCREVFEAKSDEQGPKVMNNYFEHVLGHVVSPACGRWSYSRRMRNLLHQGLVRHAWKDCDKGPNDDNLVWQPQSSSTVRKMLETRHISDPMLLCQYAVLLGSGHPGPAMSPTQFSMPLLNTCKFVSASHDPRRDARTSKGGGLLNFARRSSSKSSAPRPSGRITGSQPKRSLNTLRGAPPQPPSLVPVSALRSLPPAVPPIASILRSPPPVSGQHQHQHLHHQHHQHAPSISNSSAMNMFTTSPPHMQGLQSYDTPSEYSMSATESTTSLALTDQSSLRNMDYHPIELYSGYPSLGEHPSLHHFIGAKDNGTQQHQQHDIAQHLTQHYAQKAMPPDPGAAKQQQQQQHPRRPRRNSSPGSDCRMGGDESPVAGFAQPFQVPPPDRRGVNAEQGSGVRRRSSATMDFSFTP